MLSGMELERRRFPIGRHVPVESYDEALVREQIKSLAGFPSEFRKKAAALGEAGLNRYYRPGGWTARQVIHHVGDSHTNAYIRFKWALTEETPLIKAYFEDRWADLPDSREAPVESALRLVDAIHGRWVGLMGFMGEADFRKSFSHPETGKDIPLFDSLAIYEWHGRHHIAHLDLALSL